MKRVVHNGKCDNEMLKSYLKVGRTYEVVEEKIVDGKVKYVLKGVPSQYEYDAEWFKLFIVDTVFSKMIPVEGEVMRNLFILERSRLISTELEVNVMKVHHIGGNVYEVYAQYRNYIVIVI